MFRYKATISYDGTNFFGFQYQKKKRTIQGEIENVLTKLNNNNFIRIIGSSRTDAGAHALNQIIHFDFPKILNLEKFRFAIDSQLSNEISIKKILIVSNKFYSNLNIKFKIYKFRVDICKIRNPFKRFYTMYFPYKFNFYKMKKIIKKIIGTYDFTSFCASGSTIINKIRTIYYANVKLDKNNNELIFVFIGNGFLYKMIRILIGTILKLCNNNYKQNNKNIKTILFKKNRKFAGPTVIASGLYLVKIIYF